MAHDYVIHNLNMNPTIDCYAGWFIISLSIYGKYSNLANAYETERIYMTDENLALRDRYREIFEKEYSIVQDKLDKIGEFKFKIRGWSITIQAALVVALFTKEIPSASALIWLLLLIPLVFHFLELQQEQIGMALMARALNLEKAIDRLIFRRTESERKKKVLDSTILDKAFGAPRIGISIRNRNRNFSRMLKFKDNILYYSQYLLFLFILFSNTPNLISKTSQDKQSVDSNLHHQSEGKDDRYTNENYYRLWGLSRLESTIRKY